MMLLVAHARHAHEVRCHDRSNGDLRLLRDLAARRDHHPVAYLCAGYNPSRFAGDVHTCCGTLRKNFGKVRRLAMRPGVSSDYITLIEEVVSAKPGGLCGLTHRKEHI